MTRVRLFLPLLAVVFVTVAASAQMKDYPGYKDPALFTRMPHFFLDSDYCFKETAYASYKFTVKDGQKEVEGHLVEYNYNFDDASGAAPPSALQVVRNYQNAARKIGGQVLYENVDQGATTFRFTRDGKVTWVALEGSSSYVRIHILEVQSMQQDVTADAASLLSGLTESGHVEVPGILFDFGKSEVKPESQPALEEVAKLLQQDPKLRVWVVGHTDNVGSAESNVTLSNARAAAVIKVLTEKLKVDAKRLAPFGAGPYAPVASNTTDEGRARNRRVELVAQP